MQHGPGSLTSQRAITPTSNAAPSMHLNQYFSGQSLLKMQKIKVVQTAYAEYFEVNNFSGGYAGLQHTIDSASSGGSTSKTLIASLWDPNTASGVHAYASFIAPTTFYSRFGGEGDGAKTVNPYGWKLNTWYNIVHRSWQSGDSIFIANFIQDLSTGIWFHTSTLSAPGTSAAIGNYNDSFLEDWVGNDDRMDGRYPRKAFFKDCWALSLSGTWLKPNSRNVSVNNSAADVNRNGIYHNSFDAGYDGAEDAFFMAHGAGYTPSSIFAGGRTASLPAQTGQGTTPSLSAVVTDSLTAYYSGGSVYVNWTNPNTSSPQFSYSIDILNTSNTVIHHILDTMPQQRSASIAKVLADGAYNIRVTIRDVFNNQGAPITFPLVVNNGSSIKPGAVYELKPYSATTRNLDVDYSATSNGANVSIYSDGNSNNQRWKLSYVGGGFFRLTPIHAPSLSLDVYTGSATSGTNVQIYSSHSGTSQQWKFISMSGGYYRVQPGCAPLLSLSAPSALNTNGNVNVTTDTGAAHQKWKLEYISN
ncbi:DUF3472 domain-containing protein [Niabella insulamsoli]|uniref:DUF3472 domain-containing protein n=1 Tax=Niabella insulamsoli TaxID=3144874 RepID=UPI0031FC9391